MSIYRNDDEPDQDDRVDVRAEELAIEIQGDPARVALIGERVSEELDADLYASMVNALADLHGADAATLAGSDLLVTLYRLGRTLAGLRDAAIQADAREKAEEESRDWPTWRGTMESTRWAAQRAMGDGRYD